MLANILRHLVPQSEFAYSGEPTTEKEYKEQVTWLDDRPQPTWKDIQAARATVNKTIANEQSRRNRQSDLIQEADPLFFAWQRGESDEQTWVNKVAEIRARYPYID